MDRLRCCLSCVPSSFMPIGVTLPILNLQKTHPIFTGITKSQPYSFLPYQTNNTSLVSRLLPTSVARPWLRTTQTQHECQTAKLKCERKWLVYQKWVDGAQTWPLWMTSTSTCLYAPNAADRASFCKKELKMVRTLVAYAEVKVPQINRSSIHASAVAVSSLSTKTA